jgi:hypothetical protein
MKKPLLLIPVLLIVLTTSCKKNYTCQCTVTYNGNTQFYDMNIENSTKRKAKSECNDYQKTFEMTSANNIRLYRT